MKSNREISTNMGNYVSLLEVLLGKPIKILSFGATYEDKVDLL